MKIIGGKFVIINANKIDLENGATLKDIAGLGWEYAFYASVSDNSALDLTSGKIYIDGVAVPTAVDARGISTQKRHKLAAGDHIVTIGGFVGRVLSVKDDEVTFETGSDRTKMTVKKWAIQSRQTAEEAKKDAE